jgi:hypothetical protein
MRLTSITSFAAASQPLSWRTYTQSSHPSRSTSWLSRKPCLPVELKHYGGVLIGTLTARRRSVCLFPRLEACSQVPSDYEVAKYLLKGQKPQLFPCISCILDLALEHHHLVVRDQDPAFLGHLTLPNNVRQLSRWRKQLDDREDRLGMIPALQDRPGQIQ